MSLFNARHDSVAFFNKFPTGRLFRIIAIAVFNPITLNQVAERSVSYYNSDP
jgi:hypothetical protein